MASNRSSSASALDHSGPAAGRSGRCGVWGDHAAGGGRRLRTRRAVQSTDGDTGARDRGSGGVSNTVAGAIATNLGAQTAFIALAFAGICATPVPRRGGQASRPRQAGRRPRHGKTWPRPSPVATVSPEERTKCGYCLPSVLALSTEQPTASVASQEAGYLEHCRRYALETATELAEGRAAERIRFRRSSSHRPMRVNALRRVEGQDREGADHRVGFCDPRTVLADGVTGIQEDGLCIDSSVASGSLHRPASVATFRGSEMMARS